MSKLFYLSFISLFVFQSLYSLSQPITPDEFQNPPVHSQARTWWRWLNGNVSKTGITRDLEEIKGKEINGVTFFNISGPYPEGDIHFMTDEWKAMFKHAVNECQRLGLDFSFHQCDGWGASGGPWISPDYAMKKITYRKYKVKGGAEIQMHLKQPYSLQNYYRDIAVFAYPSIDKTTHPFTPKNVIITANHWAVDLNTYIDGEIYTEEQMGISPDNEKENFILLEIKKPFPVAALSIYQAHHETPISPDRCEIQFSDDGKSFTSLKHFKINGLGNYIQFQETKAKYFRIVFHSFTERAVKQKRIYLGEIELLTKEAVPNIPKINDFEIKSGMWHRRRDILEPKNTNETWIIPYDEIVNISEFMTENGDLKWNAPKGDWTIVRIGYTITGKKNGPATKLGEGLECDKFDVAAVDTFFNGYIKTMLNENKQQTGKTIKRVFADSFEAIGQNWTHNFRKEFKKYRGYEIDKFLLVMTGEVVESMEHSERFLFDVRATISDLLANNYYRRLNDLCHENGVKYVAQIAGEQQLIANPVYYAAQVDIPATEFWVDRSSDTPKFKYNGAVKDAISASHLFGKNIIPTEAFTCLLGDYQSTPQTLKPIADRAFCEGINQFEFHTFIHQPDETYPGWQHYPWGIAYNRKITWWDQGIAFNQYINRCQYLLQKGKPVIDLLCFTGDKYPANLEFAYHSNDPFFLSKQGYSLDACDKFTLLNQLTVENGYIKTSTGMKYNMLILPNTDAIGLNVLKKIEELLLNGAKMYGKPPKKSVGLKNFTENNKAVQKLAKKIWQDCDGRKKRSRNYGKGNIYNGRIREALSIAGITPDFQYVSKNNGAEIDFIHRKTKDADIYFISNQKNRNEILECRFAVENKQAEIWYPENGKTEKIATAYPDLTRTVVPLQLQAHQSVFVVFREKKILPVVKKVFFNGHQIFPLIPDNTIPLYKIVYDNKKQYKIITDQSGSFELHTTGNQEIKKEISLPKTITPNGNWHVSFPEGKGAPASITISKLKSWTGFPDSSIHYFSGTATYTKVVDIPDEFIADDQSSILCLGNVRDIAEVELNNKSMGVVWQKPFEIDITGALKKGKNTLTIKVTNTWANRLIGDVEQNTNYTSMPCFKYDFSKSCMTFYKKNDPLPDSGLMGLVKIKAIQR